MPYSWWSLPDPLGGIWLVYSQMLEEYATDLANIINDLTYHVARLRAWSTVIAPLSDEKKLEAIDEFINILGTVALGLPYAIKSRFTFAAAHLSHQANMTKDLKGWKDEFPEARSLNMNDLEPLCRGWSKYRPFKLKLEPIGGKGFKEETDDFRNAYNHRFSPRLVLGVTSLVTRQVDESGRVQYRIGGNEGLELVKVADLLESERDMCYVTFEAFRHLVEEQTTAIANFEAEQKTSQS